SLGEGQGADPRLGLGRRAGPETASSREGSREGSPQADNAAVAEVEAITTTGGEGLDPEMLVGDRLQDGVDRRGWGSRALGAGGHGALLSFAGTTAYIPNDSVYEVRPAAQVDEVHHRVCVQHHTNDSTPAQAGVVGWLGPSRVVSG